MPGITGIVRLNGSKSDVFSALKAATMLGLGPYTHRYSHQFSGDAEMAHAVLSRYPAPPDVASSPGEDILVAVDGEFFGTHGSIGGGPEERTSAPSSAAAIALRCYMQSGIDFVENMTGFFSLAIWDGRSRTLLLASDRTGLRPIYYRLNEDRVSFASEVKALVKTSRFTPDPDLHGISDFIVFGFPLGTRTLFASIKTLPPATIATIRDGNVDLKRYGCLLYERDREGGYRLGDRTDRVTERFIETFEAMTPGPGPYAVPLSGGLDSRCIAAALYRGDKAARTITIGSSDSDDVALGRETAKRLKFPNQTVLMEPEEVLSWIRQGVYMADGMFSALDTHILHVGRNLPPEVSVALDGTSSFDSMYGMADAILNRIMPSRYTPMKQLDWVFTHPLFDLQRQLIMADLFSSDFVSVARESLGQSLDELLASVPDQIPDPLDRTDYFEQTQRVRRYNIMGTVILRNFCEVRHPFFHPDLIDVLRRLPPGLRCKEKPITSRMVARLAPELADLPYERTGLRPDAGLFDYLRLYGRKAAVKMLQRLGLLSGRKRRGCAVDYQGWLETRPDFQDFFRSVLLGARARSRGYFSPRALEDLLEKQIAGRGGSLALLSRLVSLELWHRFFLEGEALALPVENREEEVLTSAP